MREVSLFKKQAYRTIILYIQTAPWDNNASYAGVYRQIEAQGLGSLTEKQRWIYENELKPMSVEKCGYNRTCERPSYPGRFCELHQ